MCSARAAWFAFAGLLSAQTPTATLVGRVEDPSRAAIPGASVQVLNVDTHDARTAQSQDNGEFTVSNLPPGKYEVTIEKQGFRRLRETDLELLIDQTARLDARLEVGSVAESIQVTAEVPLLNTENASRGDVIVSRELAEMPLNGRNFEDLGFMVVGVGPSEQGAKGSAMSMNGARAESANVMVDGFNDQNPRDAGAQARPPLDGLQEFKMQTSGYSAEYGRLAGGVMNMVLKSGGNRPHGSLFEFLRNDVLDARGFFDADKSKLRRNQFGATFTGPVMIPRLFDGRDRTFFLGSWESYREVAGATELGMVPSALERQGDFSQTVDANRKLILLKDPLASGSCTASNASACFSGNRMPPSRMNPVSLKLLPYYLPPNRPDQVNNFAANANNGNNWDSFVFKVDQKVTGKDNVSFRALKRWEDKLDPFGGSSLGTFGSITNETQLLLGLAHTRIFTPAVINEFRVGYMRSTRDQQGVHAGHDYAAELGITGTTADPNMIGFPRITITNLLPLGDSVQTPITSDVNNYQYNDTLTWVRSRHTVKAGGDILRVQYFQPTNSNFRGTFAFRSSWTNIPFGDFLLGMLSSSSRKIGTVTNYLFGANYGFFVQDDYKAIPNLTLNIGLRYEILKPPMEKYGQLTNYIPGLGKIILADDKMAPNLASMITSAGLEGLVGVGRDYSLPASLVKTDYLNFAPRFGLAWRPFSNNRSVLRGGYGIFYGGQRLSPIRTDMTGGYPFSVSQSFTRQTNNPNMLTLSNPFPASLAKLQGVTDTNGYEFEAPSQYLQSWNLTVEREISRGVGIEAGYAGSKGSHLGRKYNINQTYRAPALQLPDGSYPKPVERLNSINYFAFGSNSSYNAGLVSVHKRFQGGLFFRVNYTFARSIDDASGLNYAGDGGYQGAQDSRNLKGERGRSDFDVRHVMSMNFTYQLPFRQNWLIRGWQLASTGRMYSGQPITPQLANGSATLGEPTRPDRIANGRLEVRTPERWFDVSAFPVAPLSAFRFGNSGRNILDGPGLVGINLSLVKRISMGERGRAQIRWEAFNVTNHSNLKVPNLNVDVSNVATITSAQPARIMQVGLRYEF